MSRNEKVALSMALLSAASPAFAGVNTVPAPVAGVGIGAVFLIGVGYRVLRGRTTR